MQGAAQPPQPNTTATNAAVATNGGTMFGKPIITTVGGTVIPAGVTRTVTGSIPPGTATTAQIGAGNAVQSIHPSNMFVTNVPLLLNTVINQSQLRYANYMFAGGTSTIPPNFLMRPGTALPTGTTINPSTGQPNVTSQPPQPQQNNNK
nr:unnamed protein product [Naegleria fowleri]